MTNKMLGVVVAGAMLGALMPNMARAQAAPPAAYQLQQLAGVTYGFDMNNAGLVVGSRVGSDSSLVAVTWFQGATSVLPQLPAAPVDMARGVSQNGIVVGTGFPADSGVRWQGSSITVLNPTPASADGAFVSAVNNSGVAVGATLVDVLAGEDRATQWSADGAPTELRGLTPNGNSWAWDINNTGLVVGQAFAGGVSYRAVQWFQGVPTALVSPGAGTRDVARGISESGLIVGASRNAAGRDLAAQWVGTSDLAFNLGTLPGFDSSWANAVNRSGQAVGSSYRYADFFNTPNRAVLWDGFVATDLNLYLSPEQIQAGWKLYDATSINDAGSILINGVNIVSNEYQAFLLTAVPEPGTWALWLAGLAGVGSVAKRRLLAAGA